MSHPRGRRPLAPVYVVRLIVVVLSLGQPLLAFGQGLVRGLVDELVVGGLPLPVAPAGARGGGPPRGLGGGGGGGGSPPAGGRRPPA